MRKEARKPSTTSASSKGSRSWSIGSSSTSTVHGRTPRPRNPFPSSIPRPRMSCTRSPLGRPLMSTRPWRPRAARSRRFRSHARAARRAAGQDHRGLQEAHEGDRRRHLRRDGRAARASRRSSRPAPASATCMTTLDVLKTYPFEERLGSAMIVREPIGVVGMITPWNWPLNQIACKVAPGARRRLHHGAEAIRDTRRPRRSSSPKSCMRPACRRACSIWSMATGRGSRRGHERSHPGIDMVSFTGSTRAGIDVVQNAAPTVKRVTQELGGKSPNIILEDADLVKADRRRRRRTASTTPASPATRRPACWCRCAKMKEARRHRQGRGRQGQAGRSQEPPSTTMGPVVNRVQWEKIQGLIKKGIDEGATLVTGGLGPAGRPQQGLLRAPDGVRRCHQRHDDRARGDLRAGAVDHRLQGRGRRRAHRQRHALRPGRLRLVGRRGDARAAWRAACAPATSISTARPASVPRRSAATSSPATAANGAASASRSISR